MDDEQTGVPIEAAARLVGVSVGQLDSWGRTGVVRPSQTDAGLYSLTDLRRLRAVKRLLDAVAPGVSCGIWPTFRDGNDAAEDRLGYGLQGTGRVVLAMPTQPVAPMVTTGACCWHA